eukprot:7409739-Pyramimonas_sp.AAC.1
MRTRLLDDDNQGGNMSIDISKGCPGAEANVTNVWLAIPSLVITMSDISTSCGGLAQRLKPYPSDTIEGLIIAQVGQLLATLPKL